MLYAKFVAMRALAVVLVAWPASFAVVRFAGDLDFYWFALIISCPLYAFALWHHSAPLRELILMERAAVGIVAKRRHFQRSVPETAIRITQSWRLRPRFA